MDHIPSDVEMLSSKSSELLGIYLVNELKMYVHRTIYTQMFIAALFTIANTWEQCARQRVNGQTNCGTSIPWNYSVKCATMPH